MTVLYLTARNMSLVREARWVYGAFHLNPQCSEVRRHCPSDLATITVPDLVTAQTAWKTRVTLGKYTVGHLCARCYGAEMLVNRRQEIQQALGAQGV